MQGLRKNTTTGRRRDQGFTLVELMVVIGLLVIFGLLTTSFDTNSWLANHRLRGAARDLNSQMQKARMNAIKENRNWGVLFIPANNTYQLQVVDDAGNWVSSPEPAISLPGTYGSGIGFSQGAAANACGTSFGDGDGVTYANERATFNPQGFGNGGYSYISSNEGTYCIGSLTSGALRMRKWTSGSWK